MPKPKKKTVKKKSTKSNSKPKTPRKKIMLVQPGCPYCADAKAKIKDKIKDKKVQVISVRSKRGQKLTEKLNIKDVPTFVVEGKTTGESLVCNLNKNGKSLSCSGNKQIKL